MNPGPGSRFSQISRITPDSRIRTLRMTLLHQGLTSGKDVGKRPRAASARAFSARDARWRPTTTLLSGIYLGSGSGGSPRPRRPRKRRGPGCLGSLEVKLLFFYIYIRTFSYGNILTARGLVDTSSMSLFGVTGFSYAPVTPCFARSVVSGLGPGRALSLIHI